MIVGECVSSDLDGLFVGFGVGPSVGAFEGVLDGSVGFCVGLALGFLLVLLSNANTLPEILVKFNKLPCDVL